MAGIRVEEPDGIKPQGLGTRLMTAVVYAAVMLGGIWFGEHGPFGRFEPLVLGILMGVFAGFAAAEFYALSRREARLPNDAFGIFAAVVMPVSAAFWGMAGLTAVLTALIAASLVWHVFFVRVRTADTALTVFGAAYTGFLLAYLVLILIVFRSGMILAYAVVFSVWANDSLAYLVGSTIGRHKMVPRISPKKSWEGFAAGIVGSIIVWVGLAVLFPDAGVGVPLAVAIGCAVGLAVFVGDLFESRMKREAGVKDSGTLLPGHGGFLDRLDSLILVCLVAYWMLHWSGVPLRLGGAQ
ncbi:MAG: phosphatidate cytidylyltransferase [Coriobacteriia bacterium]